MPLMGMVCFLTVVQPGLPATRLGEANGNDIYVQITYQEEPGEKDGTHGEYLLDFQNRNKDKVLSHQVFDAGASFGIANVLAVDNFVRVDRKQVFISVEMGSVQSYLLDFDGKVVRKVYARTVGRVHAYVRPLDGSHCLITEEWPKNHFRDVFDSRTAKADRRGYIVRQVVVPSESAKKSDHGGQTKLRRK